MRCPGLVLALVLATSARAGTPAPGDTSRIPVDRYLEELEGKSEDAFSPWVTGTPAWRSTPPESLGTVARLTPTRPPSPVRFSFQPAARYNRVEGLNLMPGVQMKLRGVPARLHGRVGYGTSSEEFTYAAGVGIGRSTASLELAVERDLRSFGTPPLPGNSFFAAVWGMDDGDYFEGEGWRAEARSRLGRLGLRTALRSEWQRSMTRRASFTFLRGNHRFRDNPRIDEGRFLIHDVGIERIAGDARFHPRARATFAAQTAGGSRRYQSYELDLRYDHPVLRRDRIMLGLRGGFQTGTTPFQALFHLGGPGGLRGYEVNEVPARRMLHAQADYEIGTNLLARTPLTRWIRAQIIPFADAAAVFQVQETDPSSGTRRVSDLDRPLWKFSIGLGLQHNVLRIPARAGQLRVDFARRLDRATDTGSVRLRFTTVF